MMRRKSERQSNRKDLDCGSENCQCIMCFTADRRGLVHGIIHGVPVVLPIDEDEFEWLEENETVILTERQAIPLLIAPGPGGGMVVMMTDATPIVAH